MQLKKEVNIYATSIIITLVITRIYLNFFPNANVNLLGYTVHHIFTGALILILASLMLLLKIRNIATIGLAGISTSLILDEFIYLITTDGSDQSYFSSISLIGAIILHLITLIVLYSFYYKTKDD